MTRSEFFKILPMHELLDIELRNKGNEDVEKLLRIIRECFDISEGQGINWVKYSEHMKLQHNGLN